MKMRFYSDIHEEFSRHMRGEYTRTTFPTDHDPEDTVLILAGDLDVNKKVLPFVESFADQYKAVIYCLGNHDLWIRAINRLDCFQPTKDNVYLLNNSSVEIDGVVFLGGTLWTDYNNRNPMAMYDAKSRMVDFRKIRVAVRTNEEDNYRSSRPEDMLMLHDNTRKFIKRTLSAREEGKKYVVVTHHAPSYKSNTRQFDEYSPCYYSEMDDIVEMADFWIHGHTHDNVDYMIEGCRVMTNQLGYRPGDLARNFDWNKLVDIN